ncbi:hypothetical protein KEM52_002624 [Ascosphaera acerosa]|nr:hypothetical protein KEM52_002624 [Ascosphaera acerosa]
MDSKVGAAIEPASPSTSRLKKAASFNHREPTRAGRTRPIAKSKSAPHMQTQPSVAATSVPREMQPDHLGTRQRQFAFVNYTIEDKDEILAAVAPSGTMKTRARREQEAREETRRLEEAALAAIIRAGGNPEDLRAFLG